ncbi:MAG: hypothetical protein HKN52_03815 [Eudoraea sp.]|nr:hypothetical protein [Eudoraea sp.]
MRKLLLLYILLLHSFLTAQNIEKNETILTAFDTYSELPREVVFVHVNKAVFIKGENIGFKAYVLDKDTKKRSLETKNLYCIISDEKETILKKQLIRIEDGIGNGTIVIDSLFTTGNYTLKAYTNWMRNFSEPNYFEQTISIIDPEKTKEVKPALQELIVDAQFLPESGHALVGIDAVFGVVIKDEKGFGYPFVEGRITEASGKQVASFKVNSYGIGRFAFIPQENTKYFGEFTINNTNFKIPVTLIKNQGVTCTVQDLRDKIGVILTSKFANESGSNDPFMLTIHNGDSIKALDISFRESSKVIKVFPKTDLYAGLNVFTLFDTNGTPVLERLYFNHEGVNIREITPPTTTIINDSITLGFSVKGIDPAYWNSLSISVLPETTETYKAHHNLPSYSLLSPYVKGPVENALYYFTNITPRKKYELDNLLITQGWSSYEWNTVINKPPKYLYDFEKGISYIVTPNRRSNNRYFISPTRNHEFEEITLAADQKEFSKDDFFPLDDEKLGVAEIGKSGGLVQAKIFVRFKPTFVPPFQVNQLAVLGPKTSRILEEATVPSIGFEGFYKLQMLEEVVLREQRNGDRIETIRNKTVGNVDFFQENDFRRNQFLSTYLSTRGYAIDESNGLFTIRSRNPNSLNNATPIIYLDGVLLTDFNILYRYSLDIIDYIEVNSSGVGGGIRGGGGIIKIITDPLKRNQLKGDNSLTNYDIPLTFSSKKRFYNPMYNSYTGSFYNTYGAVDWYPDIRIDTEGNGKFTFYNYGLPKVKLFIEGIVNDHEFVSDVKEITIE